MIYSWLKIILASALLAVVASPAFARTGKQVNFLIAEMMERGDIAEEFKKNGIELYWGDQQPARAIEKEIDEDTFTKSSGVFTRSQKGACGAAFEELFEKLIKETKERGANALVGIRSYNNELPDFSSTTEFRCDVGVFRAVVGFKFRFVKLAP